MATSNYRQGAYITLSEPPILEPVVVGENGTLHLDFLHIQPIDVSCQMNGTVALSVDSIVFSMPSSMEVGIVETYTAVKLSGYLSFEGDAAVVSGSLLDADGELEFEADGVVVSGSIARVSGDLIFGIDAEVATRIPLSVSGDLTFEGAMSVVRGKEATIDGGLTFECEATILTGAVLQIEGDLIVECAASLWPQELASQFTALAVNTITGAVSEFNNYGLFSIVEHEGKLYGSDGAKIYELSGSADDTTPISVTVEFPEVDLFAGQAKRAVDAVLTYRSDGAIELEVVYGEDEPSGKFTETIAYLNNPRLDERKVDLPRGAKDRVLKVRVKNVNGSDLELDSVVLLGEPLSRRR